MKSIISIAILSVLILSCSQDTRQTGIDSAESKHSEKDSLAELRDAYSFAITEYINARHETTTEIPDTLFFGKHDQFPEIDLSKQIAGWTIVVLTDAEYKIISERRKHSEFINMIHTVNDNHWEFRLIAFYDYAHPQCDFWVYMTMDPQQMKFSTDSIRTDDLRSGK
jgi:hypothetical protein